MEQACILAIDQGTSGTKALIFDEQGQVVAKGSVPLKTYYLEDGFVEQDPQDIYQNVVDSVNECLQSFAAKGHKINEIKTSGISNQRETLVVWDKQGLPLYNAVVWQCKRSITVCSKLKEINGLEAQIRQKTGLIVDPYFSGTKLIWLYENVEKVRNAINAGECYFGTVDTWLLYKLTNGQQYLTDYTNASRTLFFNLQTLTWDAELLAAFGLQNLKLPALKPSSAYYGESTFNGLLNNPLPVTAMIGDSHAAAFGEGCFEPGTAKATLGTGCSILMNIGSKPKSSDNGMMTTICWSTVDRVDYALEGVIVSCGSTIEWLKNELSFFTDSKETEAMALKVLDNNGVYIIPAFSGLGAPHWDMNRKGEICGLTFGCNKNHVVRAALEAIPYQIKDVIMAMEADTGLSLQQLMVNGGMISNNFVLQMICNLLNCKLLNNGMPDVSAKGAALLAGLGKGVYNGIDQIRDIVKSKITLMPQQDEHNKALTCYQEWLSYLQGKY